MQSSRPEQLPDRTQGLEVHHAGTLITKASLRCRSAPLRAASSCLQILTWLDPAFQESLAIVAKESFKVYKAISEGLINLADRFFEMEYLDAQKGLEIYKEAMVANERLQVLHLDFGNPALSTAQCRPHTRVSFLQCDVPSPVLDQGPAVCIIRTGQFCPVAVRRVQ